MHCLVSPAAEMETFAEIYALTNFLFQINIRQQFCPFWYSSVVSSTSW